MPWIGSQSGLEILKGFNSGGGGIMWDHLCLNCCLNDEHPFLLLVPWAEMAGWAKGGIMKAKSLNSQVSWQLIQTLEYHGADQRKYICKPSKNNRKKLIGHQK